MLSYTPTSWSNAEKKSWTILIYMAAFNDLARFALKNLEQIKRIGGAQHAHILINYNGLKDGQKKSVLYRAQKDTLEILQEFETTTATTDAGDSETLVRFCSYSLEHFPADHYALIFWNHGTGILDPKARYRTPYLQLFSLHNSCKTRPNPQSSHALPIKTVDEPYKAVCFDDETGNFLTEADLVDALTSIKNKHLPHGFDLIGFDACLMAMVEIASAVAPFAKYLVASQEVELGWGWNYESILKPFMLGTIQPKTLGIHIINSYAKIYASFDDFALSLIHLEKVDALQHNICRVAYLSIKLLEDDSHPGDFRNVIKLSRNKHFCTHFEEPSFIDLAHFYQNMENYCNEYQPHATQQRATLELLKNALHDGIALVAQTVLHNKNGKKATKARGVSIYFPERLVHPSYIESGFAQATTWLSFLKLYLQTT